MLSENRFSVCWTYLPNGLKCQDNYKSFSVLVCDFQLLIAKNKIAAGTIFHLAFIFHIKAVLAVVHCV